MDTSTDSLLNEPQISAHEVNIAALTSKIDEYFAERDKANPQQFLKPERNFSIDYSYEVACSNFNIFSSLTRAHNIIDEYSSEENTKNTFSPLFIHELEARKRDFARRWAAHLTPDSPRQKNQTSNTKNKHRVKNPAAIAQVPTLQMFTKSYNSIPNIQEKARSNSVAYPREKQNTNKDSGSRKVVSMAAQLSIRGDNQGTLRRTRARQIVKNEQFESPAPSRSGEVPNQIVRAGRKKGSRLPSRVLQNRSPAA